ncbi:MAG: hypothetical protein CM1200mP31_5570 [Candidatus Neomarinimicrobiota bacterium]|nr:MAG: hypothetical protein CM1200mP31_5570 [Candidatus Neomarinimicrobiota bacterium]
MKILFILTILSTCLISQDVGYKLYKDGEIESALGKLSSIDSIWGMMTSPERIFYKYRDYLFQYG